MKTCVSDIHLYDGFGVKSDLGDPLIYSNTFFMGALSGGML